MEQHYTTDNTIDNTTAQELRKFRRNGGLIRRKLIEYIPVMILTNLLLLLISTVNGLIAGNFFNCVAHQEHPPYSPFGVVVLHAPHKALFCIITQKRNKCKGFVTLHGRPGHIFFGL